MEPISLVLLSFAIGCLATYLWLRPVIVSRGHFRYRTKKIPGGFRLSISFGPAGKMIMILPSEEDRIRVANDLRTIAFRVDHQYDDKDFD